MNVLVLLGISIVCFGLAVRFYSSYIARKLGEDPDHPTPAVRFSDGRDYVPTKTYVVFAHLRPESPLSFPSLRRSPWHSVVSLALRH